MNIGTEGLESDMKAMYAQKLGSQWGFQNQQRNKATGGSSFQQQEKQKSHGGLATVLWFLF